MQSLLKKGEICMNLFGKHKYCTWKYDKKKQQNLYFSNPRMEIEKLSF